MATPISNLTIPAPNFGMKTTTPATSQGGKSLFDLLGISSGMGFGGKPLFPAQTAPSTATNGAQVTSSAGLLSTPKNTSSPAQNGVSSLTSYTAPKTTTSPVTTSTGSGVTGGGLVQPPAPAPSPYSSIVSGLVNAAQPGNNQNQAFTSLMGAGQGNQKYADEAARIGGFYSPLISQAGKLGADAVAAYGSTGSNIVGEGNSAIASANATSRMQALAAAEQAALAGNAQGLTAQSQMASAYGAGLTGANTQQGQTITGLSNAGTLAQPSTASYGQTVFDPLTGTYSGGQGNLDPQTTATNLANEVKAGRMTYDQAVSSLGYAGGAGQQFLNNALQGSGYNIPQGQAALTGQTGVLAQLPFMESANTAAEGIKSKITTYLASNPQLNPSQLAVGNTLQQWIQGKQLTDPKYQTLFNYLNEYTNTLAPILGVGGDPTNLKTQIAQSFINAAANGQSIATVLDNMQSLSAGKIQDLRSGATGGGVVSSPISGSGTGSGGLYDF